MTFVALLALYGFAPGATSAPTTKPADNDESAVPQALIDTARDSFVVVRTYFKKDTSETPDALERNYTISRLYDEYVDKKRPALATGLVLDAAGHVLTVDVGLEDRFIDRIEVAAGGQTFPAVCDRLLLGAQGVVLKVDAKAAGKLKPLKFAALDEAGVNTSLREATLYQADDQWRLRFGTLRPSVSFAPGGGNVYYGARVNLRYGRSFSGLVQQLTLLADERGRPVGCATTGFLDLRQEECLWKGPDLLKAEGMDWSALSAAQGACRGRLVACVQEVVLVLRSGAEEGEEPSPYAYRRGYGSYGAQAAGREISEYGIAIGPREILVPQPIDSKLARQIEKIYLKQSPTRRQALRFVGAYKPLGAFVVALEKGELPAHVKLAGADPVRTRPFWMARMRKRFGDKYVDLSTNRLYGKERGYEGRWNWYTAQAAAPGTLLVNFQGELLGAVLQERTEHEAEQRLEASRRYRGPEMAFRIFTASELRDLFAAPAAHVDPKIEVKPKTLARRRAWFGVEFVPVTGELAEMLKVEKPTKDGQLGFLVNAVYAGSPAEKLGVKVGDILLRLQAPGMPYPIELASRLAAAGYGYGGRRWMDIGGGEQEDIGPVEPTWKNRVNLLTRALDAVGVGKTIELTCYRGDGEAPGKGALRTIKYAIELAPPDMESAPRWQNRKLGLTVKDLTYEVRHALNLHDPAAGVIVAKVEPGSPTLVAKIFPNEIITRLNDQPLRSARQMRDLVAAAKHAGSEKVRLTILRLGKTRFADLGIGEHDPTDDEGLDETEE